MLTAAAIAGASDAVVLLTVGAKQELTLLDPRSGKPEAEGAPVERESSLSAEASSVAEVAQPWPELTFEEAEESLLIGPNLMKVDVVIAGIHELPELRHGGRGRGRRRCSGRLTPRPPTP